ncbi:MULTISPECIES: hypothetical protein [unclassified Imperialibacter]|uniref:hypothetical protein n=1 Tax=unclassified Imperialibacter TaxID=2629706 RepID=UPI0012558AD5|nr:MULTISPECIES: hypothetical protein [unclassified Imperialibacter]CAD5277437.1 conserved hypothetical protein [Imperialibacter sp. 89]CAD5299464.1 conserved hypothetical protein [Imperialibacter sp. 75]VVT27463.1 conserved hypothetical protein [Imperialibacter sp. EC-SDR9]
MVILGKKYGRLANRLWIFSYFVSNAIEYKYSLIYRNFDEYIKHFPSCKENDFLGYPIKTTLHKLKLVDTLWYWFMQAKIEILVRIKPEGKKHFIYHLAKHEFLDLNSETYLQLVGRKQVIVRNGGFRYQDDRNLNKHKKEILKIFQPEDRYLQNIDALFSKYRNHKKVLIGVHMRKYDYRTFRKGIFFYTDDIYLSNMAYLQSHFASKGKEVQFLVCSDEALDENFFQGYDAFLGAGNLIEDPYSFAKCDYLIGPPSTYTMWGSFYGNSELAFIEPDTKLVDIEKFHVMDGIGFIFNYH